MVSCYVLEHFFNLIPPKLNHSNDANILSPDIGSWMAFDLAIDEPLYRER